jgi:SAM-dependent methyltransferase
MNTATMSFFDLPAGPMAAVLPVMRVAPKEVTSVDARLRGRCWDFPDSKSTRQSLHGIHPYPAKFIAEIPRALIAEFAPQSGTLILDPFCGSGTSLVEAQRAGYEAVGVDLNPIACRISRVKTGPAPRTLGLAASRCRDTAAATTGEVPADIPNLSHWFQPQVSDAVSALKAAIQSEAPSDCRDALELALSSILVRVSNQDSDTRYAAVSKEITRKQVLDLFLEAAGRLEAALRARPACGAEVKVLESDILSIKPDVIGRRVGLVVTSPPYPNAYEYWLYHKYRMWWLGHDALRVKEREIGARAHFFGGGAKAGDFEHQMAGVFRLLDKVCTDDAAVCFVVGDSKIHGRIVDNAESLKAAASASGFVAEGHVMRNMRASKKSFNLAHARIRQEHILVFKRHSAA